METDLRWYFSESSQMNLLKERIEEARDAAVAESMSRAADSERLRKELANVSGSLEQRINNLSRSFGSYVELDNIREALTAYHGHADARRHAGLDLTKLAKGELPAPREDVETYWLPPAVAALRPDGSIDDELARRALGREEEPARIFFTAARAAFGKGEEVLADLQRIMTDADHVWDEEQLMLWAAMLRGGFGPRAMDLVLHAADPALSRSNPDDWEGWVLASASSGATPASQTEALNWVSDRLAELEAGSDEEARSWWVPEAPTEDGADEPQVMRPMDPATAWQGTRDLLLAVAQLAASRGADGERELLTRAAELRAEYATPDGPRPEPEKLPQLSVVEVVRDTIADPHVSLEDRRSLWRVVGPRLVEWAAKQELMDDIPAGEVAVYGTGLKVTHQGLDNARFREEERRLEVAYAPDPHTAWSQVVIIAGVVLALAGVLVPVFTRQGAWVALALAGGGLIWWGRNLAQQRGQAEVVLQQRLARLRENVDTSVARAKSTRQAAVEASEERRAAAYRVLELLRG